MEQDHREFQTVILAAFPHDIGKLPGRSIHSFAGMRKHPRFPPDSDGVFYCIFSRSCNVGLLTELVQKHHHNRLVSPIIAECTDHEYIPVDDAQYTALADTIISLYRTNTRTAYTPEILQAHQQGGRLLVSQRAMGHHYRRGDRMASELSCPQGIIPPGAWANRASTETAQSTLVKMKRVVDAISSKVDLNQAVA